MCYLWEIVKSLEEGRIQEGDGLERLEKQLRRQVRVEMRRYFVRRRRRNVRTILTMLALVGGVVYLFGFWIGIDRVSGDSMYPYLNSGDLIVYSRTGGRPERDEVIVFEKNGEDLVKRVAGLPGDTVKISASGEQVSVNGIPMRGQGENRTEKEGKAGEGEVVEAAGEDTGKPMTVMDGQYLVLGDNRRISIDSRDRGVGTVAEEEILGRVVLIVRISKTNHGE